MRNWLARSRNRLTLALGATMIFGLAAPDAALACRGSLGDFVWLDLNRNGVQDGNEPGIAGVRVELLRADGTTVLRSTTTNASGYYAFTETTGDTVCLETFLVRVETPAGLDPATVGVGGNAAVDSNDHNGTPVQLSEAQPEDMTLDFGFVQPVVCNASIGNFVWNDLNNNGIQEAGEPGIPGNLVSLTGAVSASATTNASGFYSFGNLCAATYTVCATTPLNFQISPDNRGSDDALDSDGVANQNNSCTVATVGERDAITTIDFGFRMTPSTSPGTGTPGYWKNHSEAWPVDAIEIGGVVYTKAQALHYMGLPDGDKTITMFRSLVSAKLNVLIGNNSSCVASTIAAADGWMARYGPVGNQVKARTQAWKEGEPLYQELDAYNNGDRCAPHRD